MGIQGLIPFLEKSSRLINISQYSGCTVAVDAYCWLHKGAFSCADKLASGTKTDVYVNYCMKFVNMLISHNIKVILVFDGRHLPAKADTEKKRRQNREINRRRAAELLRQERPNEARTFLQRCVDVTHTMALELMRACRARNVDCITAPYEADAQLAYLNINNIAHIIITEDSDLLLFGCTKVVFKLDINGNGLLVDQDNLHLAMGLTKGCFSMDKFRYMCILSGCDYLPSLPKIGLAKACRFIKSTVDPDIHRALSRLGGHLNMNIVVPLEYRNNFMEADAMFRHQPVYDPLSRRLVPLTPLSPSAPPHHLLSQEKLTAEQQLHLALGNLDPFTLERVDDWTPDKVQMTGGRTNGWNAKPLARHKSIWLSDFKPRALVIEKPDLLKVKWSSTSGRVVEQSVEIPQLPAKRSLHEVEEELNSIRLQFAVSPQQSKKPRIDDEIIRDNLEKTDETPRSAHVSTSELLESPKRSHTNPFTKTTPSSDNKFSGLSKLAQFKKTTTSTMDIVRSRYFVGRSGALPSNNLDDTEPDNTLKDVSNVAENQTTCEKIVAMNRLEKLSDSSINSLIQDLSEDVEKDILNVSNGKENISAENVKSKQENTFKWRPSLVDMFGFKSKTLSFSPAVRKSFVKPSKDIGDIELQSECSEGTLPSDELQRECGEDTLLFDTEKTTPKRNPFAKTPKLQECSVSFGSQGSSQGRESDSDISTPCTSSSEDFTISPSTSTVACVTPQSQRTIGLSKKQTLACHQKSLLHMFAFKPKVKLKR